MANDTDMVYPGKVLAILPNGHYKVKIQELDFEMQAYKGGKMKRFHINLLPGDWVDVVINQYDISKGRITYRHKGNPYLNKPKPTDEEAPKKKMHGSKTARPTKRK